MRTGKSSGTRYLRVHYRADHRNNTGLVGFVVPKRQIPLATDRNRVKRQLRHIAAHAINNNTIHEGDNLVISVFSHATGQPSPLLEQAFLSALDKARQRYMREVAA